MKCKNIECKEETKGKNVYCSLTCRNIYVNKYMRDYSKYSQTVKDKQQILESQYLKSPKICKCGEVIPYKKRRNSYCNSSCVATFTNQNKDYNLFKENIRKGIHKYLIDNKIKEEGQIGLYVLTCKGCNSEFKNSRSNIRYCSDECRKAYRRKDVDALQAYRTDAQFKFNLADYPDEFDFTLIEKYGWYSPKNKKDNLSGVSRDHMFSVREGFEQGIDAKLLAHPANCKLMIHNENVSKHKTSSITLIELLQRIEAFDKKYLII